MSQAQILALGGGKGGAGRSTIALQFGAMMAQRGQRVLLVDVDTAAPLLHVLLGMPAAPLPETMGLSDPNTPLHSFLRKTPIERLSLLSFAFARHFPYVRPRLDAGALMDRLRELRFDVIILDLPSDLDPIHVSLFSLADSPVLVTQPDPASLLVTTQFVRACIFHSIGNHPETHGIEDELMLLMRDLPIHMERPQLLPSFLSTQARRVVRETCARFTPHLLFNKLPPNSDHEMAQSIGAAISLCWFHILGVYPRTLGGLPRTPNAPPSPLSKRSSNPARLFVEAFSPILQLLLSPQNHYNLAPRPITDAHSPSGILGLHPSTDPMHVFSLLKLTRELYTDAWKPLTYILHERDIDALSQALDRAHTTLLARSPELDENYTEPDLSPAPLPHESPSRTGRYPAIPEPPPEANPATSESDDPNKLDQNETLDRLNRWLRTRRTSAVPQHVRERSKELVAHLEDEGPSEHQTNASSKPSTKISKKLEEIIQRTQDDHPTPQSDEISEPSDPDTAQDPQEDRAPTETDQPTTEPEPAEQDDLETTDPDQGTEKPNPEEPSENQTEEDLPEPPPEKPTKPAPPPLDPPAGSPGAFIRNLRRQRRMSLRELSLRTKIGLRYLDSIETMNKPVLPRPVYLRGYLREIAQAFDVDAATLIGEYFSYLEGMK